MKTLVSLLAVLVCSPLLAMKSAEMPTITMPQLQQMEMMHEMLNDDSVLLLDSILTYDADGSLHGKAYYSFDTDKNLINEEYYGWNYWAWVGDYKYEYTYNSDRNITSSVLYRWQQNGSWEVDEKQEFAFDENGYLIGSDSYTWKNGEWVASGKSECVYDASYYLTTEVNYTFFPNGEVREGEKLDYTYDASGNRISSVLCYLRGDEWVAFNKEEYTYDGNGCMASELEYKWWNDDWTCTTKRDYTYDADGNQTSEECYYWANDGWDGGYKNEYTYDEHGNEIAGSFSYWQNGTWVVSGSTKYEYIYDEAGNPTYLAYFYWRNGEWIMQFYLFAFYSEHVPNAIGQIETTTSRSAPRKVIRGGEIQILNDGRTYNVGGQSVSK